MGRNHNLIGLHQRRISELDTTLTDDSAIAAAAKAGGSKNPVTGNIMPRANGMPRVL